MIFDCHGDILTDIIESGNPKRFSDYHLPLYKSGGIKASIFVNYHSPFTQTRADFVRYHNAIDYLRQEKSVNIIENVADFSETNEKIDIILGIEGASQIIDNNELTELYAMGYRHLGITWNEQSKYASGSIQTGGLTTLGESLIAKAVELGMIVDVAHLNEESFWGVARVLEKPLFVSHTAVKSLVNHPRNLTDEQIKKVASSNGVIGVAAMNFFISNNKETACLNDFIDHVQYIVELVGDDHVGFGFDYCYYLGEVDYNDVQEMNHISDSAKICAELQKRGMSTETIEKIMYKNVMRIVKEYLK
ncbi:MAG: dipeptidase [Mycoplasmatales bacterium]